MPVSTAQIFSPGAVTFSGSTTGLKLLTTINTTLPAGASLIIIRTEPNTASAAVIWRLVVRKAGDTTNLPGSDVLYQAATTSDQELAFKKFTDVFFDSAASANQGYDIYANVTTSGSTDVTVTLKVIILNSGSASDFVTSFQATEVSVASGATATVNSISIGSGKWVVIALENYRQDTTTGATLDSGNIRIKLGTTIVSSTDFPIYNRAVSHPTSHVGLIAGVAPASNSTVSLEVVNNTSRTLYFITSLVAFSVADYQSLDTSSVSVGTIETTIGSLSVTLTGNYAVIGILTFNNGTASRLTTSANMKRGSTTVDSRAYGWVIEHSSNLLNTNSTTFMHTSNTTATYTITAIGSVTGLNGEAKILAFSLPVIVSVSDGGVGVESVGVTVAVGVGDVGLGVDGVGLSGSIPVSDTGSGVEMTLLTIPSSDAGAGIDVGNASTTGLVSDAGSGVETVLVTVPGSDVGASSDVVNISSTIPVGDAGYGSEFAISGFQAYTTDTGSGVDNVSKITEALDVGSGIELVDTSRQIFDAGSGVDTINSPQFNAVGDAGAGSEAVITTIPQSDTGVGSDAVDMNKEVADTGIGTDSIPVLSREVLESGAGIEAIDLTRDIVDGGLGVDAVDMTKALVDSGLGVEQIDMAREIVDVGVGIEVINRLSEVKDTGVGVEMAISTVGVMVQDSAVGADTIGLVSIISIVDVGVGAELAETQLSIYGVVTLGNSVIVGVHSIPYRDLARDGLPIQTQRRFVDDRVYIGGVEVGVVTVEWEDKVADIVPGVRTMRVAGVVRLVE